MGLYLYLLEDAEAGEWIARYSVEPLTRAECDRRKKTQSVQGADPQKPTIFGRCGCKAL